MNKKTFIFDGIDILIDIVSSVFEMLICND